jgi:hypothetical protein
MLQEEEEQALFNQRPSMNKHKLPTRNLCCIQSKHPLIKWREEKKNKFQLFFDLKQKGKHRNNVGQ